MRLVLIIAAASLLCACVAPRAPAPPAPTAQAGPPKLAEGLWAILDSGCPKPAATDFHSWPQCASPFWISRDKAVVVRSKSGRARSLTSASFAADYHLAPGVPLIAEVGTEKDGYMYLALKDLSQDAQGRLIGAVGAAVACPKAVGTQLSLKPSANGCEFDSLETVRKAAVLALQDPTALSQVAWIAPGAP